MNLKNKKISYICLYFFSFILSFGILVLVNKIEFIPLINNILIGLGFLFLLVYKFSSYTILQSLI